MRPRSRVLIYGLALAVTAIAVLLRLMLDPLMGDTLPLVTLFGAVAFAVWLGGYRPALLATILGYLGCAYLFIEPRTNLGLGITRNVVGLVAYLATCSIIIALGEALRRAQLRADNRAGFLRVTLTSIGDGVITTDARGRVTYLNPVAEALTDWSLEDARGKPLEVVFQIIDEQTRKVAANPVEKVLEQGVVVGLANHTVLIAKDGTERPIDDSAAPIRDPRGEIAGCVLVFRDVTARRQEDRRRQQGTEQLAKAEARIRAIMDNVLDGIITIDEKGIVATFNSSAKKIFGYAPEEVVGRNVKVLMPEPYHGEHDSYLSNYRRTGEPKIIGKGREVSGRRKDGTVFPMDLAVSEFRVGDERFYVGIVRDITSRKTMEAELRARAHELTEADRRKDEFLAVLAHELRNPLAPIINAVAILRQKGPPQPELMWAREVIHRQSQYMGRLLEDLLDVSRISRNNFPLRKERLALVDVVQQAIETSRPQIELGGHQFKPALPSPSIRVHGDPLRLTQALANLLNNAAKYTDRGGTISLVVEREGSDAVITVADNGIGIAPEHLARVFDIFSQAAPALERAQGGLGIGLSLVRAIVLMHGGHVEARSDGIGHGSTFTVRLPIMTDVEVATSLPADEEEPARGATLRILVGDDNADALESLAMILRLFEHDVHEARDGAEAVAMAETLRPDVILLDIGMPKMNGYDAARRIREQPWGKNLMLVALTGWGQEEDRERAREAGFDEHCVKPIEPTALLKLLQAALGRVRASP